MMIDRAKTIDLLGGNEVLADKLIAAFRSELPQHLDELSATHQAGDWKALSNRAHMLKTQAGYLGLDELQTASSDLEYITKTGVEMERVQELVVRIMELLNSIRS